jgi:phosphoenolpyruvate carboxylase
MLLIIPEFYCHFLVRFAITDSKNNQTPIEIVNSFSNKYLDNVSEDEKISLMFRFIQYVERQIVLFDAIEDAAFPVVNNMEGSGSLRDVKERADTKELKEELIAFLEEFNVRTVLNCASNTILSRFGIGNYYRFN